MSINPIIKKRLLELTNHIACEREQRMSKTLIYHCKIQLRLECLITEIRVRKPEMTFRYQPRGMPGLTMMLKTNQENESMTRVSYLKSQRMMNFVVMGQVQDDCLLGILRGRIVNTEETIYA